jgi:glycosyltransferase involved in cell wall biosynthesis
MLASIITPVLNGERTIERTLRSVSVQRGDFEHIVMDGGSTDSTPEIVRSFEKIYPVRLVQQKDRSLYEGLWNGVQLARGEILSYINADDIYMPWTIATVRHVMTTRTDVRWLTGIPTWMHDETKVATTCGFAPIYPQSFIARGWYSSSGLGFLQQESMFWRRTLWEEAKPEDILLKYKLGGDFHLWCRFATLASLHTVAAVLACFVLSDQQASQASLAKYLLECGVSSKSNHAPGWGRAVHRLISMSRFRRAILPHRDLRAGAR